jgi:hypothetical protein
VALGEGNAIDTAPLSRGADKAHPNALTITSTAKAASHHLSTESFAGTGGRESGALLLPEWIFTRLRLAIRVPPPRVFHRCCSDRFLLDRWLRVYPPAHRLRPEPGREKIVDQSGGAHARLMEELL